MITEQLFYGVRCDRCGDDYESSGDYSYMTTKGDILDCAIDDDWEEIDGKHYCPCCYEKNPDPEHDDDHEYRPKPPYPEYISTLKRFLRVLGGWRQEEKDGYLHVKFHTTSTRELESEYRAMIDKILCKAEYRIEVHTKENAANAEVEIIIKLKRFYKGDRIRVITHKPYRDAFGKKGKILKEAPLEYGVNGCYTVQIFDDENPDPYYFGADDMVLIKKDK